MTNSKEIFSTPIWGYVLNNQKEHIKQYIDDILALSSSQPSARKSNFGGWQSSDDIHLNSVFKPFVDTLNNIAAEALSLYSKKRYSIQSMWANVNYTNNFNAHHIHEGYLSGVFYLQVPANSGRLILVNPAIRSGMSLIRQKDYPISPEPLACILFPSWLEHYVEPNNSEQPRISISFNIGE